MINDFYISNYEFHGDEGECLSCVGDCICDYLEDLKAEDDYESYRCEELSCD